jgi:hypothetical protein
LTRLEKLASDKHSITKICKLKTQKVLKHWSLQQGKYGSLLSLFASGEGKKAL